VSVQAEAGDQNSSGAAAGPVSADRPEVAIGIAFAGGFLLAQIIRRLGR
jgi:hypothetical protein